MPPLVRTTLPIEPGLPLRSPHFVFTTTINANTYEFDFQLNTAGDFWVLQITRSDDVQLFRQKIVYDMLYMFFDEGWGFYFRDEGRNEVAVTGSNLGDPVVGYLVGTEA